MSEGGRGKEWEGEGRRQREAGRKEEGGREGEGGKERGREGGRREGGEKESEERVIPARMWPATLSLMESPPVSYTIPFPTHDRVSSAPLGVWLNTTSAG